MTLPFPTRYHHAVLAPGAVHPVHYYQLTDPALVSTNNVDKGKRWRLPDDLENPTKYRDYIRNETNSGWILEGSWGIAPYDLGQVPVADIDGYLWPGDVEVSGGGGNLTVSDAGSPVGVRPELNLIEGSNITLTISDNVVDNRVDVTVAAGGGSITQAYVGYNTIGGSQENVTGLRVYLKSITLANDCLLTAIEAHVDFGNGTDNVDSLCAALFTDNAGNPHRCLGYNNNPATSLLLDDTAGAGGGTAGRWFSLAMGRWLVAGTYWIAVYSLETVASLRLYYDGSGSDKYYDSGGTWITDAGFYTVNSTTNRYSIRANTIR